MDLDTQKLVIPSGNPCGEQKDDINIPDPLLKSSGILCVDRYVYRVDLAPLALNSLKEAKSPL